MIVSSKSLLPCSGDAVMITDDHKSFKLKDQLKYWFMSASPKIQKLEVKSKFLREYPKGTIHAIREDSYMIDVDGEWKRKGQLVYSRWVKGNEGTWEIFVEVKGVQPIDAVSVPESE